MKLAHIGWNLGGLAFPLAVAAATIPHLLATLGPERFGLLALAWGLIGYAGALDLGIGRALTQFVSRLRGENNLHDISAALTTACRITLISGLVGAAGIVIFALLGGYKLVGADKVPPDEIYFAVLLLAIALPAQAMSATYRGVNEAFLNFKNISILRALLGAVNFGGPFAISFFSVNVAWLVFSLVISRLLALVVFRNLAFSCISEAANLQSNKKYSSLIARRLFEFGGWVTLSSIISPLMSQADRFFIAATLSVSAVSIYVIPYEMVVQCLVVVGAVSTVLFPELTRLISEGSGRSQEYLIKCVTYISILMSLVCGIVFMLLPALLHSWLGGDLSPESVMIGRIILFGVFFNSVGVILYSAIHALGRSDITAKFHMIELPIYLFLLFILLMFFGVVGAAVAWSLRMFLDTCLMGFYLNATRQKIL